MRTAGAYRLILNALIVAGMTFELASENCLRFTYVDGIYMIKVVSNFILNWFSFRFHVFFFVLFSQANPKDIDQLHSAIEHRLRDISKRARSHDDHWMNHFFPLSFVQFYDTWWLNEIYIYIWNQTNIQHYPWPAISIGTGPAMQTLLLCDVQWFQNICVQMMM